ncbi:MAG: hypothetical protein ACE5J2_07850 [Nitrososphaerales archaeon]
MKKLQVLGIVGVTVLMGGLLAFNPVQRAQAGIALNQAVVEGGLMCTVDAGFNAGLTIEVLDTDRNTLAMLIAPNFCDGDFQFIIPLNQNPAMYTIELTCENELPQTKTMKGQKKIGHDLEKICRVGQHYAELDVRSFIMNNAD